MLGIIALLLAYFLGWPALQLFMLKGKPIPVGYSIVSVIEENGVRVDRIDLYASDSPAVPIARLESSGLAIYRRENPADRKAMLWVRANRASL